MDELERLRRERQEARLRSQKAAAQGLCVYCAVRKRRPNRVLCQPCADKASETAKKKRQRYTEKGLCILCGRTARKDRKTCWICSQESNMKTADRYLYFKEQGICTFCHDRPAEKDKVRCKECRELVLAKQRYGARENRTRQQKKRQELKLEVFAVYGGAKCNCCGETTLEFLQLDHIDNDGFMHRKMYGVHTYAWLKRNNFPPVVQILCANCNFGKKMCHGICPHQKQKRLNKT